jgi:hypothetical protein
VGKNTCPSETCPSGRTQANKVMTRFESALLPCPRTENLPVGPASSQRCDDWIQVSTSRWPCAAENKTCLPDRHQANEVMTRSESALLAFQKQPKTCPSDPCRANDVMTRFESAPLPPKNLSAGPASSQGSDDSIRVSTARLPMPAKKLVS